jgi:hypothetical protein
MNRLRAATPDEVESIKLTSDLDAGCLVLALDTQSGTALAVVRTAVEVDPLYSPEGFTTKQKAFFMRDVETFLAAKGVSNYYFNIDADATEWQENLKKWGSSQVSVRPELRFKKVL